MKLGLFLALLCATCAVALPAVAGTMTPSVQGVPATPGLVIPPPSVDPGMVTLPATPQAGTMPVIPPPGTPGSKSPVQPK